MKRVVLVDPSASSDFAVRLTRAGFDVTQLGDCAIAAEQALAAPPRAVVAPARMSGISGIQLCRLLRAEPATARVSVILYGEDELPARFWAAKAGAAAYLVGPEIDDLERCVANAVAVAPDEDGFFVQLNDGEGIVQARIAEQLDQALFDSTIAAELRALASCASLDEAFGSLVALVSQLLSYGWFALSTAEPAWIGLHGETGLDICSLLGSGKKTVIHKVRDAKLSTPQPEPSPLLFNLILGDETVGRIAVSPTSDREGAHRLVSTIARELAVPLRAVALAAQRTKLERGLRHAQKAESVGRLAAGLAHELNTPLQYAASNVSFLGETTQDLIALLQTYRTALTTPNRSTESLAASHAAIQAREDGLDLSYLVETIPKAFADAVEGLTRMASIIRAMKQLAAAEHKGRVAVDVNAAIENVLVVTHNARSVVADIATQLAADLPSISGQAADINQVLVEVLANAIQAIRSKQENDRVRGRIEIKTVCVDDGVTIEISDTGAGIPEAIQHRIYDPFFTTQEVGRGRGQGLATAWAVVVEQHGGRIDFQTREGVGTTFRITFPIVPSVEERISGVDDLGVASFSPIAGSSSS